VPRAGVDPRVRTSGVPLTTSVVEDLGAGERQPHQLTGFRQPLDVTQDSDNGNLSVTELGASRITLLKPSP
jgi:hypothetical protein